MTPFVRGFAIASVLLGAFALYAMWFMQRPVAVEVSCVPILGSVPMAWPHG